MAALAQRGARVVGLDLSMGQLAHARRYARDHAAPVSLVCGDAGRLPFAAASFDIAYSDHGGIGWGDPRLVIPEVGRVLRSGGRLVWAGMAPLHAVCWNDTENRLDDRLHHEYAEVRHWSGPNGTGGVHLSHGEAVRVLVGAGFVIENLIEVRAPSGDARTTWAHLAPIEWARRWPVDDIWVARRV